MDEYEVHCEPAKTEAYTFRFNDFAEANREAERLCREHHTTARVLRVLGRWVSEPRWISNGVPGYE